MDVTHVMAFEEQAQAGPFSGAENHLFALLEAQRDAGLRVRLVMLVVHGGPRLDARMAELRDQGIEARTLDFPPSRWPARLGTMPRFLRAAGQLGRLLQERSPTLVHTHLDTADLVGKLAARHADCRIVSSVHNNEPHYDRFPWRTILRRLDQRTSHYIAISQAVRRQLVQVVGLAEEKVTTIPYGLAPPPPSLPRAQLRQAYGIGTNSFVVGFVGRLVKQKNLPMLIEALARAPGIQGVLVGAGPMRAELEALAAARPAAQVRFLGHVDDAATMMNAFDVLCLPSHWEGLGLVLLEAMFRGVPVIGSRAGAIPEILGEGAFGLLFDPHDINALADLFRQAQAQPQAMQALAVKARTHALETYTIQRMVERTLKVYEKVSGPAAMVSR